MWDDRLHPNFQSYCASVLLWQSFKDEVVENQMLAVDEQIIIIIIIVVVAGAAALCEIIRR